MTLPGKGGAWMYESDRVVGMTHWAALRFLSDNDLWDEVVELKVDWRRIVVAVIH